MCQKPTNVQSYLRYTYILIMLSRGDELQSKYHFLYTMRLTNILPFWDISSIQKYVMVSSCNTKATTTAMPFSLPFNEAAKSETTDSW